MKSILEELFYGNVCPNTDCRSTDKETKASYLIKLSVRYVLGFFVHTAIKIPATIAESAAKTV